MSQLKLFHLFSIILVAFSIALFPLQSQAASKNKRKTEESTKERLVLMPLRVPEEDKNLAGAMETALVKGLQQKYDIFSGEQVSQKAHEIFMKETRNAAHKECDEAKCMQNIAMAFQAELIATANITKKDGIYFLALSIQNIFDNKVVYSESITCESCNEAQVVEKLKVLVGSTAAITTHTGNNFSGKASWVEIGSDEEHNIIVYSDRATIVRNDDKVSIWSLNDFRLEQTLASSGKTYFSSKIQFEIDCKTKKLHSLAIQLFSNNMGKGHQVSQSYIKGDWKPIAPQSGGSILMKFACGWTNWKQIVSDDDMSFLIDPEPINKIGNIYKVWNLIDFKKPQLSGNLAYQSLIEQNEIDCKESQFRTIAFWWYSENMGAGEEIHSVYEPDKWIAVFPGSNGAALLKFVCGKP